MSLNISLPAELENRVRQRVESGSYGSASEVIREALRLLDAFEGVRKQALQSLKADIAEGMADREAGRLAPLDVEAIKREGRAKLSARK